MKILRPVVEAYNFTFTEKIKAFVLLVKNITFVKIQPEIRGKKYKKPHRFICIPKIIFKKD